MALVYQKTRAETVCSLGQNVFVLLNDKSRMKGDLHVRFREKFEVKVLLLTRLRGRELITPSYSILGMENNPEILVVDLLLILVCMVNFAN